MWILVAASKDLSREHIKELHAPATLWERMDHPASDDRVGYGSKWWQTGERKPVKLMQSIQIWVTKGLNINPVPRDQEDRILSRWIPPDEELAHLTRYLTALPSGRYREDGVRVVATDGALSKVRGIRTTGTATVEDGKGTIGRCRVGGPCSSTRAELVGIWLAITSSEDDGTIILLVDSANAMQRLNWFRRAGFRPPPHEVPDWDVIRQILEALEGHPY